MLCCPAQTHTHTQIDTSWHTFSCFFIVWKKNPLKGSILLPTINCKSCHYSFNYTEPRSPVMFLSPLPDSTASSARWRFCNYWKEIFFTRMVSAALKGGLWWLLFHCLRWPSEGFCQSGSWWEFGKISVSIQHTEWSIQLHHVGVSQHG